jgi:hypothetical protein
MTFAWISAQFSGYFMSFYLKYMPGNIFVNCICASSASIIAGILALSLYKWLGTKGSMLVGYGVAAIGTFMMCLCFDMKSKVLTLVFLFTARLGIMALNVYVYFITL